MKKLLLFTLTILNFSLIFGQSKAILYDFSTGKYKDGSYISKIKDGTMVVFTIENINRNVYNVSIKGETVNYWTDIPALFGAIKIPEKLETTGPNAALDANTIINPYNDFRASGLKIEDCKNLLKNLNYLLIDGYTEYSIINSNRNKLVSQFTGNQEPETQLASLMSKIDEYYSDALEKYDKLLTSYELWGVDDLIKANDENISVDENNISEIQKKKLLTDDDKTSIEAKKQEIIDLKNSNQKLKNVKYLVEVKAKSLKSDIDSLEKQGFRGKIISTYNKLNSNNFEINYPLKAEGDELNFAITVKAKPEAINAKPDKDIEITPFPIKVYGGWKFDFSTGLFCNLGNSKFHDNSYRLDPHNSSGDTLIIVSNKIESSIIPSFGALAHIYYKCTPVLGTGISFGVSTEQLNDLNYHLGVSIFLLNKSRLVISGGVTMRQAIYIDPKYSEGQLIPKSQGLSVVPTTVYNRAGGFVSISYNFAQTASSK